MAATNVQRSKRLINRVEYIWKPSFKIEYVTIAVNQGSIKVVDWKESYYTKGKVKRNTSGSLG